MLFVNRWRMDLIFLISGLSVHFLLPRHAGRPVRRASQLAAVAAAGVRHAWWWCRSSPMSRASRTARSSRASCASSATTTAASDWPEEAFDGWEHGFTWNHLWYLAYLWVYTMVLAAAAAAAAQRRGQRLRARVHRPARLELLVLPAIPLLLSTLTLQPLFERDRRPDPRLVPPRDLLHRASSTATGSARDAGVWAELVRLRTASLRWCAGLFAGYLALVFGAARRRPAVDAGAGVGACATSTSGWRCARSWAGRTRYLNRPLRWLPWANEAVYPWYVLHQSLIVLSPTGCCRCGWARCSSRCWCWPERWPAAGCCTSS